MMKVTPTIALGVVLLTPSVESRSREFRFAPVSVALLLDVSYSMSPMPLDLDARFVAVIRSLSERLRPGDRAAVGRVSARLHLTAFSTDRSELVGAWRRLPALAESDRFGPSPLWDVLAESVTHLAREQRSSAAILWADGRPTGNRLGAADVAATAGRLKVAIFVIVEQPQPLLYDDGKRRLETRPCAVFEGIVALTGGACLINEQLGRPPLEALNQIMRRVRERAGGAEAPALHLSTWQP